MSALRKITMTVAALLVSVSAMLMTSGTASADCPWNQPMPCRVVS